MKTRLRFTKTGSLKFIGHLDCMRFFQKALRRAKWDVAYSGGFSPHQIMSFASPLSVGLTSDGEYIDIEFHSLPDLPEEELLRQLNSYMTEELFVTEIHMLEDKAKTSMSLLNACDYLITWKDGTTLGANAVGSPDVNLRESFTSFMEQERILVMKKTKRSEKEIDLKPLILNYAFTAEEFEEKNKAKLPPLNHEYDSEDELYLTLVSGSVTNIKPELVLEAYVNHLNLELKPFSYQVHRIQMYFESGGKDGKLEKTARNTEAEE